MGVVARWRDRLPVTVGDARPDTRGGRDAADRRAGALGAARRARVPEDRGREPDRQLQGPRHGGGDGLRGGARRSRGRLRVDREHGGLGRGLRRARRDRGADHPPGRRGRRREARPDAGRGGGRRPDRGHVRRRAAPGAGGGRPRLRRRQLGLQPRPDRRPAHGGLRDRRDARARRPTSSRFPYGGGGNTVAYRSGFEVEGVVPRIVSGEARERQTTIATAIRIGEPVHAADVADANAEVVTLSRRRDPRRLVRPGPARRGLLRAVERGRPGRASPQPPARRLDRRLRADRQRAEGRRRGRRARAAAARVRAASRRGARGRAARRATRGHA